MLKLRQWQAWKVCFGLIAALFMPPVEIYAGADKQAPSVPSSIKATADNCSQISLSWKASTDTGASASGVKLYSIYRGGVLLKTVNAPTTNTTDTTVIASTSYSYAVSATDNAGNQSAKSTAVTTTTPACPVSCVYTISSTDVSVSEKGASNNVSVTAAAGCSWGTSRSVTWVTITGGATGNGNGTVSYTVAANTSTLSRSGTLTIAGQTFTVNQAGVPCGYSISPASISVVYSGATGNISVTSGTGCSWTASSGVAWITITAGASGSGNGTVSYSVAANTSTVSRSGTLTIAGQTFTVDQAGAPCTYSISPGSASTVYSGGTGSVGVTAGAGCAWTASSGVSWVTITAGSSGSGNDTVSYSVAANSNTTSRSGTLTIAGQTFTVNQAAAPCAYSISPGSVSVGYSSGTGSVSVTAGVGCAWAASSGVAWVTITAGASGSGNGTVSYSIAANSNANSRSGTVTVAGQTFTVNQAGAPCAYSISPSSVSVSDTSSTGSVNVTAGSGCSWTASSGAAWITITAGASGSANGIVDYSVAANSSTTSRSGTLTIAGQIFTVNQSGAAIACAYSIYPTLDVQYEVPCSGNISVTADVGCTWTATSPVAWATITAGATGSGSGTVTYSLMANTSPYTRATTLTIAGQAFTLYQSGGAVCSYAISPTDTSISATAASGNIAVTDGNACGWSASSSVAWITVTAGSGNVSYSVAANSDSAARTGTISIADKTFTVNQAGSIIVPDCSAVSILPTSASYTYAGGSNTVAVSLNAGCPWSVNNAVSWITITAGASGSGNGAVSYAVSANPNTVSRSGTLTIAGQSFTVNQAAAPCTYSISSTNASYSSAAGGGSVNVISGSGCTWNASSPVAWISITAGATGIGNGSVSYSVLANTNTISRSATLTIATQSFTVNQDPTCAYSLSASSTSMSAAGGNGSVDATTGSTCGWTVSSAVSWITVTSPTSGSGSGTMTFSVAANPGTSARTGVLTIAGANYAVNQAGQQCTNSISVASVAYCSGATNGSVNMTANATCTWNASSAATWISITSGATGTGPGTVNYSIAANTTTNARTGTIAIGDKTLTVTQAEAPSISPAGASASASGGNGNVNIATSSGCTDWTATSNVPWIVITVTSKTVPGYVAYSVSANSSTASRIGTLTIAGQTFTVTQSGNLPPVANAGLDQTVIVGTSVNFDGSSSYDSDGTIVSYAWNFGDGSSASGAAVSHIYSSIGTYTVTLTVIDNSGVSASDIAAINVINNGPTPGAVLWAAPLSTSNNDISKAIASDSNGNVVIAGDQSGQFLVAKYSPSGAPLWIDLLGTGYGKSVVVDSNGNILAAAGTGPNGYPYAATFVVKLSPAGDQVIWSKSNGLATDGAASPNSIAVDGNGDVLVTGSYWGTLDFGNGSPRTAATGADFFIVKYRGSDGAVLVLNTVSASSSLVGTGVGADSAKNIYLAGIIKGSADFGGGIISSATGVGVPFLAKYTSAGVYVWATAFTGASSGGSATGLGVTTDGVVTFTGSYINSFSIGGQTYTTSSTSGSYIAQFSGAGTVAPTYLWSKNLASSTGLASGSGVAVDPEGNVALTGTLSGTFDFGSGAVRTVGNKDIYVAKFSPTGQSLWARGFGSTVADQGNAAAFDPNGNVLATGVYSSYADFGTGAFPWSGQNDGVVLKLAR